MDDLSGVRGTSTMLLGLLGYVRTVDDVVHADLMFLSEGDFVVPDIILLLVKCLREGVLVGDRTADGSRAIAGFVTKKFIVLINRYTESMSQCVRG